MKTLYVDMDGTLAKWKPVEKFEELYEPGFFLTARTNENVVNAIRGIKLHEPDIEVKILSARLADSPYAEAEKIAWLQRNIPEIPQEDYIFTVCGEPKSKFISEIDRDSFLLDDYTKNLLEWEAAGGTGIKLLNGINHTHGTWQGLSVHHSASPEALRDELMWQTKFLPEIGIQEQNSETSSQQTSESLESNPEADLSIDMAI